LGKRFLHSTSLLKNISFETASHLGINSETRRRMISAIVRIDESRVEVEHINLVKFRPEALGWHFRYPQVDRTFAWLSFHRRLSKDYEYLPETSEAFFRIAMIRLMLARLS